MLMRARGFFGVAIAAGLAQTLPRRVDNLCLRKTMDGSQARIHSSPLISRSSDLRSLESLQGTCVTRERRRESDGFAKLAFFILGHNAG